MFILIFTVEGRKEPYVCLVEDQGEAAGLYTEYTPRASVGRVAEIETRSPGGTPGFAKFRESDLISVEIYEELDPKEEERRAHLEVVSAVESRRRR